ncbi:MAG: class A beta-lactamase-related serine hydrolase [Rhodospirillaceae bacterium]|nr:class A beta-lactamase-related serine hydrolase [Rhodospirillaceae bacterium]
MGIVDSLKHAVEAGDVPGVAAMAATADGTIFEGAAGALKFDSVIWIASMTKAITGAAAMQMVEQGKFGLDTPAADIVPEIARKEVLVSVGADGTVKTRPAKKPITLRHLLTHTSGMGYDTWNVDIFRYAQAKGPLKPNSMEMLSTPLLAEPGERWEYSISIDWAGLMVEVASGMKLDRYMKDNLLDPLQMPDTAFKIGPAMRARKAAVHVRNEAGGFTATDHELNQAPEVFMGGGALYSTIGDYLRFTRMILGSGTLDGVQVLKPETVALMSRNAMGDISCRPLESQIPGRSTDMNFVDGMKWGLTFMINPAAFPGGRSAGSLSWGGLANSYYWIDPVKKVTGVWATQLLPFYDARAVAAFEKFERCVYAAL